MTMRAIAVDGAPKAIGPYSQGQVIELPGMGRFVFTAGQVGLDPARGELVDGGIAEQTERVFQNLHAVLEGALKLKEISYIHAEGYPAAEMKHGPIALIDENMPVVFICTRDAAYDKVMNNMMEVRARRGRIIAIATEGDRQVQELADHVLYVPPTVPCLQPLLSVIPLQLLAYHTAVIRGCDVDQPRNLAKSVTVE